MKSSTKKMPPAEGKAEHRHVSAVTNPTEHKLFPVQIRNLALRQAVAAGVGAEEVIDSLSIIEDADIVALGVAYGVDDVQPAYDGRVDPSEEGDVGERLPVAGPLQNILARLANLDPEIKKKLIDALLRLVGIII